jgi:hypothetical protein
MTGPYHEASAEDLNSSQPVCKLHEATEPDRWFLPKILIVMVWGKPEHQHWQIVQEPLLV